MGGNLQRAGDWRSPLAGLKLWKEACAPENSSKEQSATTEHLGPSTIRKREIGRSLGCSNNDDIEVESDADKRAHHNALERKRRDHIKDSFHSLRDSVPSLQEKASQAQILDKATEYIQYMRRKNHTHQQDIDDLKRQNALLEQQVRALEKARSSAQLQTNYPSSDNSLYTNAKGGTISAFDGGSDSSSESEPEEPQSRKKLWMEAS
uniref:protein max-like n=1 Tax=Myodes glareolus TaxID=447135 RepID=UPI00202262B9|nr:protein max-like [Myodes glareolus]